MNPILLDLGYREPYQTLADFLATHPKEARECQEHGWFTATLNDVGAGHGAAGDPSDSPFLVGCMKHPAPTHHDGEVEWT